MHHVFGYIISDSLHIGPAAQDLGSGQLDPLAASAAAVGVPGPSPELLQTLTEAKERIASEVDQVGGGLGTVS